MASIEIQGMVVQCHSGKAQPSGPLGAIAVALSRAGWQCKSATRLLDEEGGSIDLTAGTPARLRRLHLLAYQKQRLQAEVCRKREANLAIELPGHLVDTSDIGSLMRNRGK